MLLKMNVSRESNGKFKIIDKLFEYGVLCTKGMFITKLGELIGGSRRFRSSNGLADYFYFIYCAPHNECLRCRSNM